MDTPVAADWVQEATPHNSYEPTRLVNIFGLKRLIPMLTKVRDMTPFAMFTR
jgi:hypothetical protein